MSELTKGIMLIVAVGVLFGFATGADFNNSFLIDLINGVLPEGINTNGETMNYGSDMREARGNLKSMGIGF